MRRTIGLALATILAASACAGDPFVAEPDPLPEATADATGADPDAPDAEPSAAPSRAADEPDDAVAGPEGDLDGLELRVQVRASGLVDPIFAVQAPGDDELLVVEQVGRVRRTGDPDTYLDIRDRVGAGGERGLFAIAFHPAYEANGRVFAHYTDGGGTSTISEFARAADGLTADPTTERVLLTVEQPAANHNGGMIAFGPDGHLWIALGDGGAANDRFGNGQRPDTLLGTLLRIDVDSGDPYGIPDDNPFADSADGAPEVWAYGLRNPWRFSFDDGNVYVADVGQNAIEEISVVPVDEAGANYGWPVLEGTACFEAPGCSADGLVLPAVEYTHRETDGCSVIGGYVYRGSAMPALRGHYLYADLCAGLVRSFRHEDGRVVDERDWTDQVGRLGGITSFGVDARGELYATVGDELLVFVPA